MQEAVEDDEGIDWIAGEHQTGSGSVLRLGVGTVSGKWSYFGDRRSGAVVKNTGYRGSERRQILGYLSSEGGEGGWRLGFHWVKQ